MVRCIMLGVGGHGRTHVQRMLAVPDAQIVALVDPSEQSIAATRQRFPALAATPAFADYSAAFAATPADMVIIVSPHSQHMEHGMAALDAGLHVLMEKPFVAGSANARRLIAHAQQKGKHLAVAYQRHLEGPYMYIRGLIQSGEMGQLTMVNAYQAQSWLTGTAGTWRQDPDLSCGGQLNDSGSHLLDVVLWIAGQQPLEVMAQIDNRGTRVDIDSSLSVRFDGGAIASFTVVGSSTINWWEDVSFHCERGTILYRNKELLVARAGEKMPTQVSANEFPPESNPNANFVALLRGEVAEAAAPASCGLAVAQLTEAAWESAASGRPVALR